MICKPTTRSISASWLPGAKAGLTTSLSKPVPRSLYKEASLLYLKPGMQHRARGRTLLLLLLVLVALIGSGYEVSAAPSADVGSTTETNPASPGVTNVPGTVPWPASWQAKVDPWVLNTAATGRAEFLVFLSQQADLSQAANLPSKLEKTTYVYQALTQVAAATQGPVIVALEALGVEYRTYWVANMIWVRGDLAAVEALARRPDVAHIYANPAVRLDEPVSRGGPERKKGPAGVEWNISHVGAPAVWAAGVTGQGAVVAGQDTGYEWNHPALINQYRGWDGVAASHDYNWHDAIHEPGSDCGADTPVPCDDSNHGTHTMGTMVGDDGAGNQIGMAPGARWIGCRNMNEGVGTPATYAECYQWFIAPTRLDGSDPDPAMAPDVINNSWACPPSEGCTDPNVLLTVVNNVRAAGIVTVHSAGNSGAVCGTINDPAAIYDASFTVGATTSTDDIAGFSSRGPVTVDGSGRLKPDIVAPGSGIRSSVRGGGYQGGWSGTSMAAPHVAGLVALLVSANPALAGDVDRLESIIEQSALPLKSAQNCGGVPGNSVPNNTFGWGRIDAWAAYLASQTPTAVTLSDWSAQPDRSTTGESVPVALPVGLLALLVALSYAKLRESTRA